MAIAGAAVMTVALEASDEWQWAIVRIWPVRMRAS
jgi:hypothetical protein